MNKTAERRASRVERPGGTGVPPVRSRVSRERVRNRSTAPTTASTPGGGKSAAELVRQSNRWRDNYNPLRALTIAKVVQLLEAAERGDFAELQLVLRKIEKRYPVLKALKARRLAAIESLDWDIKVPDELPEGATEAMADAQQKFLRTRYDLIENLTDTFGQLVLAEFRGYAILQKHRFNDGGLHDGAVREFHWLPQYTWSRDGSFGDWFYNQDSRFGTGGDGCQASLGEKNRIGSAELPREEFLIREHDTPLYEIALIAFVNWAMGRKDYAAFVEIFGLPKGVAIMPPNIPVGKEDEYRDAAEKVSDGVAGALPNGSDIKFPTSAFRNNGPFKEYCDCQDADVVLAGTGGGLSMLTADKGGLGDGPSQEHADAFDEIAQADARRINETLQRDFDRVELAAEFPGQPVLAYFELCAVEEEDATAVTDRVVKLDAIGLQTEAEEVSEKVGLKLTRVEADVASGLRPEDELLTAETQRRREENPESRIRNRAPDFASAIADKIDPLTALLNRITEIKDDAAMMAMLENILKNSEGLAALVSADARRAARALEHTIAK